MANIEALRRRVEWARSAMSGSATDAPAAAFLDRACDRLGVTDHARDALWLLVACEADGGLARLAQGLAGFEFRGFSITALSGVLERNNRVASSGDLEALIKLALVDTCESADTPASMRWIKASDRAVELAKEEVRLDPMVAAFADLVGRSATTVVPAAIPESISAQSLVIAVGPEGSGRRTALTTSAFDRGAAGVISVRCREVDTSKREFTRSMRALVRECCLLGTIPLFVDVDVWIESQWAQFEREFLKVFDGPVLATMSTPSDVPASRSVVQHQMAAASTETRRSIWSDSLPGASAGVVESATSFVLSPGAIKRCAASAVSRAGGGQVTDEHIRSALTQMYDEKLASFATRIEWRAKWDDLVLPPEQFESIIELVSRVRHRSKVLETWGFEEKIGRGLGTAALLSGPPGTGKTMVAGLIASELGLDLYQVDLSRVVSKYIGETEKNLAALFDAAEAGHAILLFDEADSLFAKRSEVKSSNDRNANLEVNYLLQRMESFRGITILTTNNETAIDAAFKRRLAIHVRFPVPEEVEREQLWRAHLPSKATVGGRIDFAKLARSYAMTGGYIKNAVLRAAYIAADQGNAITMEHLLKAARAEYEGMGKLAFETGD